MSTGGQYMRVTLHGQQFLVSSNPVTRTYVVTVGPHENNQKYLLWTLSLEDVLNVLQCVVEKRTYTVTEQTRKVAAITRTPIYGE